jgi:hypothetical protein
MLEKLRSRLTYANVMATLAFMLALGGTTAYAANTVFSTDIVDGQVKTADLASAAVTNGKLGNNAVTGAKVSDGSLASGDLAGSAVTSSKLADSSVTQAKLNSNAVTSAKIADGSVGAQDLASAIKTTGASAYGHIVDTTVTRDKNIVSVSKPNDGVFCIELAPGIDADAVSAAASPDFFQDSTNEGANSPKAWAEVSSIAGCSPNGIEVVTGIRDVTTGTEAGGTVVRSVNVTRQDQPFFVVVG